jgi:cell division protein FtsI (penicillin-binding protein 3)
MELPGETRGILAPFNKWRTTSYASISIGQEVGVTPLQMVSMVSTIANGGTYLPPHILMPGQLSSDAQRSTTLPKPDPFKAGETLINPLPSGAHRVISEMAAAQMRKMMEGVILYGSGHSAVLNGYSAGGKTGTAQKIDPATHTYSKTMHIASFAGIAPVNNPVISVAVIIDNPTQGNSYYGAAVSAPVFKEVAQQTLEYLGVPHDIDVQPPTVKSRTKGKPEQTIAEDDSPRDASDINDLFAAVNDLPADDPLRAQPAQNGDANASSTTAVDSLKALPAGMVASAKSVETTDDRHLHPVKREAVLDRGDSAPQLSRAVLVNDKLKLKVPSLVGLPLRQVIEQAEAAGLAVRVSGDGTVRAQAPVAGTMVAAGTQIVVRCGSR